MKLYLLVLFLIILYSSLLNCQDTWVRTYQPYGDECDHFSLEMRICPDGGYLMSSEGRFHDDMGGYYVQGFIMKTDADGNLTWTSLDPYFLNNFPPHAFVVLSDGSSIAANMDVQTTNYVWYFVKRNQNGSIEWYVLLNENYHIRDMELTNDENIISTGGAYGSAINLQKFDLEGNQLWIRSFLNNGYEAGNSFSVIQTSDNGYVLTGCLNNNDNSDIFILKTNSNGDSLWSHTYNIVNGYDMGKCIIESNNDYLYVSGKVDGASGFLMKLTNTGEVIFFNQYDNVIYEIIEDTMNDLIIGRDRNTLYGFSKINGEQIWSSTLPTGSMNFLHYSDNCFDFTGNGFICYSSVSINWDEHLVLTRTDSIGNVTNVSEIEISPLNNSLSCYPNPFSSLTTIQFTTENTGKNTEIEIYNIRGQKIRKLGITNYELGMNSIIWNGTDESNKPVSSGIYFINLRSGKDNIIKKAVLMR